MPLPLYLLAVAVFAMGTSEFMLAGLVPDIAASLDVSVGGAGLLTSAFAVGMVVGAPLMAAIARRWPARASLLGFLLVFATTHVVGAVTTSFTVLLVTRTIAALANAGFLAVALSTAATLVAADLKGRALAVLLSGTTVATVAGVPGGALLGALLGWRATFWAIALLCVPAALGVAKGIRGSAATAPSDAFLRTEVAQLARPRLVLVMVVGAMVNAATFATFTFVAPIVTDAAGLGDLWISVALVLFGLGSFAGVTVAGRFSDRRPVVVIGLGGPVLLLGWIALATLAAQPAVVLALIFVQGALSFAVGSTLIARVLYEAAAAPTMGGSYATAALNVGAAGGPVVASATLDTAAGALGPVWVSAALVAVTLMVLSVAGARLRAMSDVRLRDVEEADLDVFHAQEHDPEATARSKFPPRDHERFIQHWQTKVLGDPTVFVQAVTVDGELAGNVVAWWADDGRRFVGYWFGREFWGRGIGTAALRRFLDHETVRPLHADPYVGNTGSVRLLEKCGFEHVETVRHGENDHAVLVLR